jgi:hypothetical protein
MPCHRSADLLGFRQLRSPRVLVFEREVSSLLRAKRRDVPLLSHSSASDKANTEENTASSKEERDRLATPAQDHSCSDRCIPLPVGFELWIATPRQNVTIAKMLPSPKCYHRQNGYHRQNVTIAKMLPLAKMVTIVACLALPVSAVPFKLSWLSWLCTMPSNVCQQPPSTSS